MGWIFTSPLFAPFFIFRSSWAPALNLPLFLPSPLFPLPYSSFHCSLSGLGPQGNLANGSPFFVSTRLKPCFDSFHSWQYDPRLLLPSSSFDFLSIRISGSFVFGPRLASPLLIPLSIHSALYEWRNVGPTSYIADEFVALPQIDYLFLFLTSLIFPRICPIPRYFMEDRPDRCNPNPSLHFLLFSSLTSSSNRPDSNNTATALIFSCYWFRVAEPSSSSYRDSPTNLQTLFLERATHPSL
ncbi:hypothetical protein FA15DRAFT_358493 [Coprinopsis marcescibilis]|uniref:Uncharacterized protein n=1 Tax=Coprinopsis marcescibilis TaxID=230819 RepID=A0A5C3KYE9_COPMA|nr:hypothetical protein FA15DRAFT_358493 [Coprinopsis marcescibilis]